MTGMTGRRPPCAVARCGFTLVELLVTIAILVVLAALAFLLMGRVRQSALNVKCVGNLRQLAAAGHGYAADHGAYPNQGRQVDGSNTWWFKAMETYLGFEAGTDAALIERDERCPTCEAALKAAPPGEPRNRYIRTYSMNQGLLQPTGSDYGTAFPGLRTGLVRDLSRTAFFTDGTIVASGRYWEYVTRANQWRDPRNFVHHGKANVVFLDGHVESRTIPEVPESASDPFWNPRAE